MKSHIASFLVPSLLLFSTFLEAESVPDKNAENIKELPPECQLVYELLVKLQKDTPFTLEEEIKFFGRNKYLSQMPLTSGIAFMLYTQAGFISWQGEDVVINKIPKYSLTGELLRMNRSIFVQDKNFIFEKIMINNDKVFHLHSYQKGWWGREKIVTIVWKNQIGLFPVVKEFPTSNDLHISLDFSLINGTDIAFFLGFKESVRGKYPRFDELWQRFQKLE